MTPEGLGDQWMGGCGGLCDGVPPAVENFGWCECEWRSCKLLWILL